MNAQRPVTGVRTASDFVAPEQQCAKECPRGTDEARFAPQWGLAMSPKSRHGPAMIDVRVIARCVALVMMTVLVAASTVIPSLSYAQKYADHLSQYGGYDARIAAITGFASLYVTPEAPMLPVVLSIPGNVEITAVLPSSCAMDKTVLPTGMRQVAPCGQVVGFFLSQTTPIGIDQPALRGPPRLMV
jgi:hypothetical protein